ncbi:SEC-C domain-containing protein [Halobacillus litoralis]|uniref:SEC-C metal-binding domain-containing protein n=1 Tax=Halobacillus litoralis TaxID=45668 RepID=UPI001CD3C2E1|nr:SEC-C metal-binding domain-containing protein [Halobacillus litoralis]MCA0970666.1 SEC-C domain-containing protein [Halobacillus litoralis]
MLTWKAELDQMIRENYEQMSNGTDLEAVLRSWETTWEFMKGVMDKQGYHSIEQLQRRFSLSVFLGNWLIDFEGLMDRIPSDEEAARYRIKYFQDIVDHMSENDSNVMGFKRSVAEAHFTIGEKDKGDALFSEIVQKKPTYGYGWIGWSDMYGGFATKSNRNLDRAIEILHQALEVKGISDREDVLLRLEELLKDAGRTDEAKEVKRELKKDAPGRSVMFMEPKNQVKADKIGRNDPCPCGSGKKHKKCCL